MALLKKIASDFGAITVTRSKSSGITAYFQNGTYHSQANQQGNSVCVYVHAILETLRQKRARNILIVGCGGGTLATMLRKIRCHVTMVDINATSFTVARDYFGLPHEVRCIHRDGIAYLRGLTSLFDAVVVDVFTSDNFVPNNFTTARFFQLVKSRMSPTGTMVMNVITANDTDRRAIEIARRASPFYPDLTLIDWPGETWRNTIIVAGPRPKRRLHIPSGNEPLWIADDFKGVVVRKLRQKTTS